MLEFLEKWQQRVNKSSYMHLDLSNLNALVEKLDLNGWLPTNVYCREDNYLDTAFDLAFLSSQAGGFNFEDKHGNPQKWKHNGSGTAAMFGWLEQIACASLRPEQAEENQNYWDELEPLIKGIPYSDKRKQMIGEFADPVIANRFKELVSSAFDEHAKKASFDMSHVLSLVSLFPVSFGADPFHKKAILAVTLWTTSMIAKGWQVNAQIPIPSDYQLPRLLTWARVIVLSPKIREQIKQAAGNPGFIIDPSQDWVTDYRAATVVACHQAALIANVPDWQIDQAMFDFVHLSDKFKSESLPAMRTGGTWF